MRRHTLAVLFSATSFLGAALLFLVQPLVVKLVLPLYGGTPTTWNTASLFFQLALLAGYLVTHLLVRSLGPRRHATVQILLVLLPLAALPIGLRGLEPSATSPVLSLVGLLVVAVGAPFLLLSTGGPLLQQWFAATTHPRAHDPYFLYAAGNVGSLLALVGYPLVVEPHVGLADQRVAWSFGYVGWVALIAACASVVRRQAVEQHAKPAQQPPEPVRRRDELRWAALAALASSLMLGTTTHLTTDLAPVPLLWVLPLALYLGTFIVAFGVTRARAGTLAGLLARALPAMVLGLVASRELAGVPLLVRMTITLVVFTAVAAAAHTRLSAERPAVSALTRFYLVVAVGGSLGGALNGLVAPLLLDRLYEYPLVLGAALLLVVRRPRGSAWLESRYGLLGTALVLTLVVATPALLAGAVNRFNPPLALALALALVVGLAVPRRPTAQALGVALVLLAPLVTAPAITTSRSFFGAQQVVRDGHRHVLEHGTTSHGWQDTRPERRRFAQSYYEASGPVGQVLVTLPSRPVRLGVIGLGSGSIAAYGRAGDRLTFFEIDQDTVDIATNPRLFTYLQDTAATTDVVIGDGRLTLGREPRDTFDVLVVDAFSSDSVPVHLLTRQALELYISRIRPDGLVLIHISNRYLELAGVLGDAARAAEAPGLVQNHEGDRQAGGVGSRWVLLARSAEALARFASDERWTPLEQQAAGRRPWTDDYSDLVRALLD